MRIYVKHIDVQEIADTILLLWVLGTHPYNEDMEQFELEGTELLARALCHECEHLDGHLYVERVEGELRDAGEEYYDEEDE